MRRPTFLILGAPKCGTTALAGLLAAHPAIFLSRPKEPHFFDAHYDKGMERDLRDHFSDWQDGVIAGEATPSYLAVPFVPPRIRKDLPHARLIAILRHPVDRAYSSWWMFHARGMDPLPFEASLDMNLERLADDFSRGNERGEQAWRDHVNALRTGKAIRIRTYFDAGYYARHLRRYYEHFPHDRIKIVFSHDLLRQPDTVIRDLWRFLGVDDDARVPDLTVVNEAVGPGARPLLRALQAIGVLRFRGLLPEVLKSWGKRRLSAFGKQPALAAATRQRLLEHFAPHTDELEALLNVDLSDWRK
ncbi:MAG: sulfotransferase domain-containing protein [Gammaproteobacteria bacterium]